MEQEYPDRRYVIFEVSELQNIDFSQVYETSADTVRKSVDQSKTFVKWDGNIPSCVENLTTKQGPYNYQDFIAILRTSEWTEQFQQ